MKKLKLILKEYNYFIILFCVMTIALIFICLSPLILHISDSLVFQLGQESYIAYLANDPDEQNESKENGTDENVKENVSQNEGKKKHYYLFLPSYAKLSELRFSGLFQDFYNKSLAEKLKSDSSLSQYEFQRDYDCIWNGEEIIFTIMKSENLPAMYITTDSNEYKKMWEDKNHCESGHLRIIDENGELLENETIEALHTRGNYSFSSYFKKPYSLKLASSASLLGLGKGDNYCLLSNASDPSMLRNHLARKMEKEMGLRFDNIGKFLDLYMNGEYQGCYYLVEKIEISPERIDISNLEEEMKLIYKKTNTEAIENYELADFRFKAKVFDQIPADISGGYLLEREFFDRYKLEYPSIGSSFITDEEECFILKSPELCSVEQIQYLLSYFNELEEAILSKEGICQKTGKSYDEYIDVHSFAIKYLVEEFTKNYDAAVSSSYYYKDSDLTTGKVYAGPAWDFDMSMGNYLDWMDFPEEGAKGISEITHHELASPWFHALCQKEEQQKLIQSYYREAFEPYLKRLLEKELREEWNSLIPSQKMNHIRWQSDICNWKYPLTEKQIFDELYLFIKDRKTLFDKEFLIY